MLRDLRKALVCWLIGHSVCPLDPHDTRCCRCAFAWEYGTRVPDDIGFWLTWWEIRGTLLRPFRCRYCSGYACVSPRCRRTKRRARETDPYIPF